ncbi:MAG TPA: hypothetical protein VN577_07260 [Terriglobales bacterium]|nr:hypothetical protein [Terriglobales bacterium]
MKRLKGSSGLGGILVLVLLMLVALGSAFAQDTPRPEVKAQVTSIERLKAIDLRKATATTLRQQYVVEGYFVDDPVPMLVKDMKYFRINTPMPESVYILIRGTGAVQLRDMKAQGSLVRATGRLAVDRTVVKGKTTPVLELPTPPKIIKKPERPFESRIVPICVRYPQLCHKPPFLHNKYALLYSGGVNAVKAYTRYWNDLKFMYLTLRSKYGFSDDNIVVVYKGGTGEDSDITVDYAASPAGFNDAIKYLRSKMTVKDDLFIFVTNHGGGYHDSSCGETPANRGGRADVIPGDEINANAWDEATYYYNQTSNDVFDDDFVNTINSLSFGKMVALFEQCFSGGFLRDLRGHNRILISAATDAQYSWAMDPDYKYDTFSYHFTSALNNADDAGTALTTNPDTNGDGNVSILEAFLYAKSKDTDCETPWLEDNGDGVGTNTPTATGTDGKLAVNAIL